MNWTKTPPTKPGAYWWKAQAGAIKCCEVFTDRDGNSIAQGFGISDDVELLRGEWCGPLVPAEDLAKAQAQCAELRSQVERMTIPILRELEQLDTGEQPCIASDARQALDSIIAEWPEEIL